MFLSLCANQHDDVVDGHVGLPFDDSEPHCVGATSEFGEGDELCHVIFWIWNCPGLLKGGSNVKQCQTIENQVGFIF